LLWPVSKELIMGDFCRDVESCIVLHPRAIYIRMWQHRQAIVGQVESIALCQLVSPCFCAYE
jgi:hypothetical protein